MSNLGHPALKKDWHGIRNCAKVPPRCRRAYSFQILSWHSVSGPVWWIRVDINLELSSISSFSTDLNRIQTPHSLFWDFRADKTFTIRRSGCRVQVWAPACHLEITPEGYSRFQKTIEGVDCKINGQALGAELRHSLGGWDGRAQTQSQYSKYLHQTFYYLPGPTFTWKHYPHFHCLRFSEQCFTWGYLRQHRTNSCLLLSARLVLNWKKPSLKFEIWAQPFNSAALLVPLLSHWHCPD